MMIILCEIYSYLRIKLGWNDIIRIEFKDIEVFLLRWVRRELCEKNVERKLDGENIFLKINSIGWNFKWLRNLVLVNRER